MPNLKIPHVTFLNVLHLILRIIVTIREPCIESPMSRRVLQHTVKRKSERHKGNAVGKGSGQLFTGNKRDEAAESLYLLITSVLRTMISEKNKAPYKDETSDIKESVVSSGELFTTATVLH